MPSERIKEFYDCESFAIMGISKTCKGFGWAIYNQLEMLGKRVYAVNPGGGRINEVPFYRSIESLPEVPEAIILSLNLRNEKGVLEAVSKSGAKYVWFQQGSFDEEILSEANLLGLQPILGCALMYMPGTHFLHKFHRAINELLGKGYK